MNSNYLAHFGIKGQKWGVRRFQNEDGSFTEEGKARYGRKSYVPTNPVAYLAKRKNDKINKSFEKWKENDQKRSAAIDAGKRMNAAKHAYEKDPTNPDLQKAYKDAEKEYKKAFRGNTLYRKGQIKGEVGKDSARRYLSDAKKTLEQLDETPDNRELEKQYARLMSKYEVERANARNAPIRYAEMSRYAASLKRSLNMAAKSAAVIGAVTVGGSILSKHTDGKINSDDLSFAVDIGRFAMRMANMVI